MVNRTIDCRYGKSVARVISTDLHSLCTWWEGSESTLDTKMLSLTLLTKLLIVDASIASTEGHPGHRPVWTIYRCLLTDTSTSLSFKVSIVLILWDICISIAAFNVNSWQTA